MPWKLPPAAFSTRTEEKTSRGWNVTFQCQGHSSGSDQNRMVPHPLSYHYLDNEVVFACSTGSSFMPENSFSCQSKFTAELLMGFSIVLVVKNQFACTYRTIFIKLHL